MELSIVLVDNHRAFAMSAQRFLELLPGVHVLSFSTHARNVMSDIQNAAPDLVLIDITLPRALCCKLENTLMALHHPPRIAFLSLHEKNAEPLAALGLYQSTLVSKVDFISEIVPLIESLRAMPGAGHSL